MRFKRGDKVSYFGGGISNKEYDEYKGTFIWVADDNLDLYIIEHPDGEPKSFFTDVPESYLQDGLKYIFADVDELELFQN